jgi:hypothetical protein
VTGSSSGQLILWYVDSGNMNRKFHLPRPAAPSVSSSSTSTTTTIGKRSHSANTAITKLLFVDLAGPDKDSDKSLLLMAGTGISLLAISSIFFGFLTHNLNAEDGTLWFINPRASREPFQSIEHCVADHVVGYTTIVSPTFLPS